ncbi:MAG: hypothetical protein M1829_006889 [Trizodia sp. TS-e1964]|nr:MAG: hypothetical protein M1829_006889 [Trizodia sp. TS-e1964]
MAADQPNPPVNGTYGSNPAGYQAGIEQPSSLTNSANYGSQNLHGTTAGTASSNASASGSHGSLSKEEIVWYFVEKYYTTLSKSPDQMHLFYTKRSQFLSGVETEKVPVSVGRASIQDRIEQLQYQDCKVRVSNVDSQASYQNIVIQVIGEMSNKSDPHRKFVQTFVLAEQPTGYFVLNDILRYINDEEDEEDEEEPEAEQFPEKETFLANKPNQDSLTTAEPEPKTLASSIDALKPNTNIEQVDRQLQQSIDKEETAPKIFLSEKFDSSVPSVEDSAEIDAGQDLEEVGSDSAQIDSIAVESNDAAISEICNTEPSYLEEVKAAEKPREPEPSPIATPKVPQPALPKVTVTAKPPLPPTWANIAKSSSPASVATAPSTYAASTSPAPSHPRAAPPAPISVASAMPDIQQPQATTPGSVWQTAGNDHARRQNRQLSISGNTDNVLAYVKNVTEKVGADELRNVLKKYGELAYFDVNRQKNCAFVEFATPTAYNAAVAANPHHVDGEQIYVEERRPRGAAYGAQGYNIRGGIGGRGGRGGPDGRLNIGPSRGGGIPKDSARGGFIPNRGRGGGSGNITPRGRGSPSG